MQRNSGSFVVRAVVPTIVCFVIAIAVSQWLAFGIGSRGTQLASNTEPTVVILSELRTDLRQFEMIAYQDLVDGRQLQGNTRFAGRRASIREEIDAYLELPTYPGEKDLWLGLRSAEDDLDRVLDELTASQPPTAQVTATKLPQLAAAFDRLDGEVAHCIAYNVGHGTMLANDIVEIWQRALYVTIGLTAMVLLLVSYGTRSVRRSLAAYEAFERERADEMETFASRIAHDLRTPLSAIGLSVDLARRKAEGQAEVVAALERSRSALGRASRLLDGLHAFARAGAQPVPGAQADLGRVAAGVLEEVHDEAEKAGVQLRVEGEARRHVACHEGVLESVLQNLVRNAIKYMGDARAREVVVRTSELGPRVRIEVQDTGPGIPAELHDVIFQPHVRGPSTGQPGIGLGLATVRKVAEAHGGAYGVRSSPGQGSTFWVELPAGAPVERADAERG